MSVDELEYGLLVQFNSIRVGGLYFPFGWKCKSVLGWAQDREARQDKTIHLSYVSLVINRLLA
jgi:hypothetical protein